jgi:hypothetical protein
VTEIVLIHLGDAKAKHLWGNIKSIRRNFPTTKVTLIYSSDRHQKKIRRLKIDSHLYECSQEDEELLQSLAHDVTFRKGFWRFSIERLLALENFHKIKNPTEPILHLESDVLVLSGFPLDSFQEMEILSWCKFNESHDVSAILFSPHSTATTWLANNVRSELRSNMALTDMTVLSVIAKENPQNVTHLPSLNNPKSEIFSGVFDGAALGMWLTGRDPRNKFGLIQRHVTLPEAQDNPEKYRFVLTSRKQLQAIDEQTSRQVYNLHIHSKNRMLFSRYYFFFLKLEVFRTLRFAPSTSFSIFAFFFILKDHIVRHRWKSATSIIRFFSRSQTK